MWFLLACAGKEDDSAEVTVDPVADIEVVPGEVDFGEVRVSGSPSDPVDLTIRNVGDADLTVTSVRIELGSPFTVSVADGVVVPGGILHANLMFDPDTEGPESATLTVESDDPDEATVAVPLAGTGT